MMLMLMAEQTLDTEWDWLRHSRRIVVPHSMGRESGGLFLFCIDSSSVDTCLPACLALKCPLQVPCNEHSHHRRHLVSSRVHVYVYHNKRVSGLVVGWSLPGHHSTSSNKLIIQLKWTKTSSSQFLRSNKNSPATTTTTMLTTRTVTVPSRPVCAVLVVGIRRYSSCHHHPPLHAG